MNAKRITLKPILAVLVTACVMSTHAHAKNEAPAINKQGIAVWKQAIPNSKIIGFKAQTVINATPKQVLAVIMDVDNSKEWIPRTRSAKVFDDQKVNGLPKTYIIVDMPMPLSDRELLLASRLKQADSGEITLTNKLTQIKGVKPSKKYIRIPSYSGAWKLVPQANNKTHITISGHADPAGALPTWVANLFVTQQPYEMLKNLKKQVKKPQYKNPKIPHITIK